MSSGEKGGSEDEYQAPGMNDSVKVETASG